MRRWRNELATSCMIRSRSHCGKSRFDGIFANASLFHVPS
jgi:hypothetical protein